MGLLARRDFVLAETTDSVEGYGFLEWGVKEGTNLGRGKGLQAQFHFNLDTALVIPKIAKANQ